MTRLTLMIEQFADVFTSQTQQLRQNDLDSFFRFCRQYYSLVEQRVKASADAFKILVRMASVLPINLEKDIVGKSEAARSVTSIILQNLSEKASDFWETIIDQEWPLLRQGLITVLCIRFV